MSTNAIYQARYRANNRDVRREASRLRYLRVKASQPPPHSLSFSEQSIGGLAILSMTRKGNHTYCELKCHCGSVFSGQAASYRAQVRRGKSVQCPNCGWKKLGDSKRLPDDLGAKNVLYGLLQSRSKRNGCDFSMSRIVHHFLRVTPCVYCNAKPACFLKRYPDFHYSTADKISPFFGGYSDLNCVPACKSCNSKKDRTAYECFVGISAAMQSAKTGEHVDIIMQAITERVKEYKSSVMALLDADARKCEECLSV